MSDEQVGDYAVAAFGCLRRVAIGAAVAAIVLAAVVVYLLVAR